MARAFFAFSDTGNRAPLGIGAWFTDERGALR